tara:strand:- start:269 stop:442 length:174 start_codon:yes stop_codon:yes gene_type:complete
MTQEQFLKNNPDVAYELCFEMLTEEDVASMIKQEEEIALRAEGEEHLPHPDSDEWPF